MNFKLVVILCLGFMGMSQVSSAQMVEANYSYGFDVKEAKVGDTVEVYIHVTPPKFWYVYSTRNEGCEISPILATMNFEEDSSFILVGGLKPIGDKLVYDHQFECSVYKFNDVAVFRQKVVIKSKELSLKGTFEGQICSDSACVPLFPDAFVFTGLKIL